MPRIAGIRDRRHQPLWDTIVRVVSYPPIVDAVTTTRDKLVGSPAGNLRVHVREHKNTGHFDDRFIDYWPGVLSAEGAP